MGSTSFNRDNTSGPRQAGISGQLSIVDRSKRLFIVSFVRRGSSAGLRSGIKASDLYSKISLNYKKASPPLTLEEWPRRKLKVTLFLFLSKFRREFQKCREGLLVVVHCESRRW